MVSINRVDKILFIKDGLSKESLDDITQIFETHPSGNVHVTFLDLMKLFKKRKSAIVLGIWH